MTQKIETILLVDDDHDDQHLFAEALYEADINVSHISALSGSEALDLLQKGTTVPHLIFMDVNMPKMSGLECLKVLQLNEEYQSIPVVMYSASCSTDYQNECFKNGAIDFIEKPNDYIHLRDILKDIINGGLPYTKNIKPLQQ